MRARRDALHAPRFNLMEINMTRLCICGSGQERRELCDARGIFCDFVCDACEERKRAGYRADIFTDPNYPTEEPIEEDE